MRVYLEYYALKSLLFFIKLLPHRVVYGFCNTLALLIFRLDAKRRKLTIANLQLAFPELNENEAIALAKKAYQSIGINVAEILLMFHGRFDINEMVTNRSEALLLLEKNLKDGKNGILLLTAHFGNWELLAHFLALHSYPVMVIGREGNNQLIEQNITTPFRKLYGNSHAHKDKAMGAILRTLKKGGIAGMLIDQKSGGANSVKTTFFNHPLDTVNSTALLKLKYNPIVAPLFMARQEDGRYKLIVSENAQIALNEGLSEEEKIIKLTQYYNDIIENIIRTYPEQWFWMHNRWRIEA